MSARVTSPEAKRIATSFAYCTTWLLVTTWPPLSQTNPVPDATPPSVSSPSGLAVDFAPTPLAGGFGGGLRPNPLPDRGRPFFEDLDIGPLGVGERPALLYGAGIRAGPG